MIIYSMLISSLIIDIGMKEIFKQVIMQVLGNIVENFNSSEIEVDKWNGVF